MNTVKPHPSKEQQDPTLFSLSLQHPLPPSLPILLPAWPQENQLVPQEEKKHPQLSSGKADYLQQEYQLQSHEATERERGGERGRREDKTASIMTQ